MDEQWLTIEDFPDYAVSDNGRIMRIKDTPYSQTGKILRPQKMVIGYTKVILFKDTVRHQRCPHRLVLETFRGPCPEGFVANHKNGDKTDNRLENLEWISSGDNIRHARDKLGVSYRFNAKITQEQVGEIRSLLDRGMSQSKIAEMYGLHQTSIHYIKSGRNWHGV